MEPVPLAKGYLHKFDKTFVSAIKTLREKPVQQSLFQTFKNKRMKTDKERIIDEIKDDIELNESRLNNIYSTPPYRRWNGLF